VTSTRHKTVSGKYSNIIKEELNTERVKELLSDLGW